MAGGTNAQEIPSPPVHWEEKYIERLAKDMEELRGMEARLTERIDANNKQTQNLALAMIIGIGAMTIAIAIALR